MSAVEAFLRQLDDGWAHKWESLTEATRDVTEEEAFFQAACYADDEREEGWPPPGSIAWQVAHVAHCKRYYTLLICERGRSVERPESGPFTPRDSFAAYLAELEAAHLEQRAAIAEVRPDELSLLAGNSMPMDEFLAMAIRHDVWHAAQIAVGRRLYRKG